MALPIAQSCRCGEFYLQQHHTVEERFNGRRAPRYKDVNRNDAVAAAYDRILIVIITAAVGARPHGDDVARLRHLVVDLASRPALFCW